EEVRRVVVVLQGGEAAVLVVGTERLPGLGLLLVAGEVERHAGHGERRHAVHERAGPADVGVALGRVGAAGDASRGQGAGAPAELPQHTMRPKAGGPCRGSGTNGAGGATRKAGALPKSSGVVST